MQYGWPKNLLHWSGIHESILDICATVTIHFVIADGSTAMGGAPNWGKLCLSTILSRQTQRASGLWGLIRCRFGISLMGAISSATFVKIASGCWRKEWGHSPAPLARSSKAQRGSGLVIRGLGRCYFVECFFGRSFPVVPARHY